MADPVQGFTYTSIVDGDTRNGTICHIIGRATVSDVEVLEMGPAFEVKFGDGTQVTAYAEELHPWYPV